MFGQSHAFFLDPHGCGVSAIPWVDISRWIAWQATCVACACSVAAVFCSCCLVFCSGGDDMGMDQYLLIPFLVGWTSIYQLSWCSPGVQGFDTLPDYLMGCFPSTNWCTISYDFSTWMDLRRIGKCQRQGTALVAVSRKGMAYGE